MGSPSQAKISVGKHKSCAGNRLSQPTATVHSSENLARVAARSTLQLPPHMTTGSEDRHGRDPQGSTSQAAVPGIMQEI